MIAHCLTGDKETWLFNSGKAFIMQTFSKSLSLPFSLNGEQRRQNSDEARPLGREVGTSWSSSCFSAQSTEWGHVAAPRHTFLSQVQNHLRVPERCSAWPPTLHAMLSLAAEAPQYSLPRSSWKHTSGVRLGQHFTHPADLCSLPWQSRHIRAFLARLCSRSVESCRPASVYSHIPDMAVSAIF